MEADGAPADQDGGGGRMLSGAEEAVMEDEKYEVRSCMCQERNWRDVARSTSLAESLPHGSYPSAFIAKSRLQTQVSQRPGKGCREPGRQVLIMGTMGMWVPTSGVLRRMLKM